MPSKGDRMEHLEPFCLSKAYQAVQETTPLVHCITNYVTVNDCANILLGCGASPIMSDEAADVVDIQSICGGLVLNIGTLNKATIEGMKAAGETATKLDHPIVLDPVGAGASELRTTTAALLLDDYDVTVVRGNMSEVKALAGVSRSTRGVDVNPDDVVTEDNLAASAEFARRFAQQAQAIVAITGAIDIVADADRAYAIYNGTPLMGKITGSGCMLTCVTAAYVVANPDMRLEAVLAAVSSMGVAGEVATARMRPGDGNGSFRMCLLDAMSTLTADMLEETARIQAL